MASKYAIVVLKGSIAAGAHNAFAFSQSRAISDQVATITKAIREIFDVDHSSDLGGFVNLSMFEAGLG